MDASLPRRLRHRLSPRPFGASLRMPPEVLPSRSTWAFPFYLGLPALIAIALKTQDVTVAAHGMNELYGMSAVDLAPKPGNIDFNDIAEFFPIVIVEVLEQL